MKRCSQCGKQAEDWEAGCSKCGQKFYFEGVDGDIETVAAFSSDDRRTTTVLRQPNQRPDGIELVSSGLSLFWISIGLSIVAGFFVVGGGFTGLGLIVTAIASILFPVSGVFWATGKIVHAISFLPSKAK